MSQKRGIGCQNMDMGIYLPYLKEIGFSIKI